MDNHPHKSRNSFSSCNLPSSLWVLQHHSRVLYISEVKEQSCKLGRRKVSCESSQTLNICILTELSHLESTKHYEWCGFLSVLVTVDL